MLGERIFFILIKRNKTERILGSREILKGSRRGPGAFLKQAFDLVQEEIEESQIV